MKQINNNNNKIDVLKDHALQYVTSLPKIQSAH